MDNPSRRAITPAKKRLFVERLFIAWQEHAPHLRFGQFVMSAKYASLFHVEDFDLIEAIEQAHIRKAGKA